MIRSEIERELMEVMPRWYKKERTTEGDMYEIDAERGRWTETQFHGGDVSGDRAMRRRLMKSPNIHMEKWN